MYIMTKGMEQIYKSCLANYKNINHDNYKQIEEYEYFATKLLDVQDENGELTSGDLNTFFYYIVGQYIKQTKLPVPYPIKFNILEDDVFDEQLKGKVKAGTKGITLSTNKQSSIYVRQSVINKAISKGKLNPDGLYKAIHVVSHEFIHSGMNYLIFNVNNTPNLDLLRQKKEYIVCQVYPDYKEKNYSGLLREKIADHDAAVMVDEILSKYFKRLYPKLTDKIVSDIEHYKCLTDNPQHKVPGLHYQHTLNSNELLDELIEDIAVNHKYKIYPMLKVEYNDDNTKKDYNILLGEYRTVKKRFLDDYNNNRISREVYVTNIEEVERLYDQLLYNAPGNPERRYINSEYGDGQK